ncbi:hypothetical protein [uncultured Roseobacter sp.]|uniref:hypothetical protein n=1 Tax=uncultured Roseobacter sp. TaxID=114847 RepID=UPI002639E72C|nr:hypothetical protein [uncultured Roseobacter sp.]
METVSLPQKTSLQPDQERPRQFGSKRLRVMRDPALLRAADRCLGLFAALAALWLWVASVDAQGYESGFPPLEISTSEIALIGLSATGEYAANWNAGTPLLIDLPAETTVQLTAPVRAGSNYVFGGAFNKEYLLFHIGPDGSLMSGKTRRHPVSLEGLARVAPVQLLRRAADKEGGPSRYVLLSNGISNATPPQPAPVLLSELTTSDEPSATFGEVGEVILTPSDVSNDATAILAHAMAQTSEGHLRVLVSSSVGSGNAAQTHFYVLGFEKDGSIDLDFDPRGLRRIELPLPKSASDVKVHFDEQQAEAGTVFVTFVEGIAYQRAISILKIDLRLGSLESEFEPAKLPVSSGLPVVKYAGLRDGRLVLFADVTSAGKILVAALDKSGKPSSGFGPTGVRVLLNHTAGANIQSVVPGPGASLYILRSISTGNVSKLFLTRRDASTAGAGARDPEFNGGQDLEIGTPTGTTSGGLTMRHFGTAELNNATLIVRPNQPDTMLFFGTISSSRKSLQP